MTAPDKLTLAELSRGDLEGLAERLLAENAALKQAVAELRAEDAALKGLQGRPAVKPSGMDRGTGSAPVYRSTVLRHRSDAYAAVAEAPSWSARTWAGVR